jgi:hypothetical protein
MKIKKKELWNLDFTLAKYILPRLIEFRKDKYLGYPTAARSYKNWLRIIDEMIWAMDYVLNEDWNKDEIPIIMEKEKRCAKGLKLFGKYFRNLWT